MEVFSESGWQHGGRLGLGEGASTTLRAQRLTQDGAPLKAAIDVASGAAVDVLCSSGFIALGPKSRFFVALRDGNVLRGRLVAE
jgi:hypothetical protein